MEALALEWNRWKSEIEGKEIKSIYFGGGTPALLAPENIQKILSWIPYSPEIEITLEANPENIDFERMKRFREAGINRISMGIQSFHDDELTLLGRTHDSKQAKTAILDTTRAGIENISIDLIYDLPNQTLRTWTETLEQVQDLPITHLSLYNLTIEPHTVFHKYKSKIEKMQPPSEVSKQMYTTAVEKLSTYGLYQYEISAFAKPNKESVHNTGYWKARPFIGFGPSAFSDWNGSRFRNVANLNKYHRALEAGESPVDFEEKLDPDARMRELVAIRIRMLDGVDVDNALLQEFHSLQEQGLVEIQHNHVRLTQKGILFYDTVAATII